LNIETTGVEKKSKRNAHLFRVFFYNFFNYHYGVEKNGKRNAHLFRLVCFKVQSMGRREKQADAKVRGQSVLVAGPHFEAKTTINRCLRTIFPWGFLIRFLGLGTAF